MDKDYDFVIIGAGMAGLSAARELEKFERKVLVIDKEDRVGGRVKTDQKDGFRMDRGFQVLLTEYPQAKEVLDYDALDLKTFKHGAHCFSNTDRFDVRDTHRHKSALLKMAFSPVGTFTDKLRMNNLGARLRRVGLEEIFERPEHSSYDYLKKLGFSDKIIKRFFEPFFAGIFLENRLETSSRMLEFVFKMFAEGETAIPAKGMEEIPRQIRAGLKNTEFKFHTEVEKIEGDTIHIKDGESICCHQIIVATEPDQMIDQVNTAQRWRQTATYYFSADKSPLNSNVIALNYNEDKLVNNFTVMSDVSKHYAPKGKHLIACSLTDVPDSSVEEVSTRIKNELGRTFGSQVSQWEFLQSYHIRKALPNPETFEYDIHLEECRLRDGLYLAGDYLLNGSLNAAIRSGKIAAQAAVLDFKANME